MTQETDLEQLSGRNWYGDNDIGLYAHDAPNSVNDYLNVKILEEGNGEAGIELYDSQGRQIQSHIDRYPGTLRLEMGTLKAGIYMVKISLDGKYLSPRRIIKR